jgi:gliding motility-associated-like protein
VYPNPVASFTPAPGILTELDPVSVMSNSSTGAVAYDWDFGDGSAGSNEEDPEHTFPVVPIQNYLVSLTAISEHGCIDTVSHLVIINEVLIYYVPNAFTPDDDEFNQTFKPVFTSGFDPFDFNMTIFDRWGEVVFETENHEIGWDGTYAGQIAMDGAYTWRIEVKTKPTDERMLITGHLVLLR